MVAPDVNTLMEATLGHLLAIDPSINSSGVALFSAGVLVGAKHVVIDDLLDECLACRGGRKKGKCTTCRSTGMVSIPEDRAMRILRMARKIRGWIWDRKVSPRTIALEWPQIYRGSATDPNDLPGLAGVGMAVVGLIADSVDHAVQVVSYLPREWIGQVPKSKLKNGAATSVRANRIAERLSLEERLEMHRHTSHDVIDAIGIGLHCLGRLAPTRVFARRGHVA